MASIEDVQKLGLRAGKIISAEYIEGSEKLLRLHVDIGNETRQILAGIGKQYIPEVLLGRTVVVVTTLESRMLMGFESQGMLLAASGTNGPALLVPDHEVAPGSEVR